MRELMLIGRLGGVPELRTTTSGHSVADFSVAVNEQTSNDEDVVVWTRCVAWGDTAVRLAKNAVKGDEYTIRGRLQLNRWTDKQGQVQERTELVVGFAHFNRAAKIATTTEVTSDKVTTTTQTSLPTIELVNEEREELVLPA
jgi:single-strand DNA-binding protein